MGVTMQESGLEARDMDTEFTHGQAALSTKVTTITIAGMVTESLLMLMVLFTRGIGAMIRKMEWVNLYGLIKASTSAHS